MAERTRRVPTLPPLRASTWLISRKVNMPTSSPYSITTSEPMSFSAMVCTASVRGSSG